MPNIGELRHRIAVENPTRTADGGGGYTETWTASSPSPVWAAIEPSTPRVVEKLVGNTIQAPITHIVTIRNHEGVTARSRFTFGSRVLHVRGYQRVQEIDQWLICACEEAS